MSSPAGPSLPEVCPTGQPVNLRAAIRAAVAKALIAPDGPIRRAACRSLAALMVEATDADLAALAMHGVGMRP